MHPDLRPLVRNPAAVVLFGTAHPNTRCTMMTVHDCIFFVVVYSLQMHSRITRITTYSTQDRKSVV